MAPRGQSDDHAIVEEAIRADIRHRLYALEAKDTQVDVAIKALERSVDQLGVRFETLDEKLSNLGESLQSSIERIADRFDDHIREERAHWGVEQQNRIEREQRERQRLEDSALREREIQIEERRARRNEIIAIIGISATLVAAIIGGMFTLRPGG